MELLRASALTVALFAAGMACAAPPQLDANGPIQLEARSSDVDYKNNTLLFHEVRISQGPLSVQADEATATGLDFNDSHWVFQGHVRITTEEGFLTSDEARIAFSKNLLSEADITGAPARFEQKRPSGVARGKAQRIEYRTAASTVRLLQDASLSDGTNEISGDVLVYNLRDQRVLANPEDQGDQRVRITINPKTAEPKHTP
jgi:lipopolysaccharide export system protein LptA